MALIIYQGCLSDLATGVGVIPKSSDLSVNGRAYEFVQVQQNAFLRHFRPRLQWAIRHLGAAVRAVVDRFAGFAATHA